MAKTTPVELRLPADIIAAIRTLERTGTDEERVKVSLAIGLFVEKAVSLAKAAQLAGMTRYEFSMLLKQYGIPAYDYTQETYEEDLAFIDSATE